METRPPVVTVLGHVDHGKTTLLDALRKTSVAEKEAGGITQSIGSSVVTTADGKKITFIDTPGHAAFTKMRSRGAKAADIAILIVAADDGVKPQTKEALKIILGEHIPYIVVLTKKDLPNADTEKCLGELEKEGIAFEGRGGDVPYLAVSAKKGEGLKELLELIVLVADVTGINADKQGALQGFVVETRKDKRGPLASLVITNGTMRIGDDILCDQKVSRVRGIFNFLEKSVKEVFPGEPALVIGFTEPPAVGSQIHSISDSSVEVKKDIPIDVRGEETKLGSIPKLRLVVKTLTTGSLEAITQGLPDGVEVVSKGVGDVIDADVFSCKASRNCRIFVFEAKVPNDVSKLAEMEGVEIESFNIIYKLFERVDEIIKSGEDEVMGSAEIIAIFPYEKKRVAGCKVTKGVIEKKYPLKIMKKGKSIGRTKIVSMKKEKKDIISSVAGEEFGAIFEPYLDFEKGDVLISIRK
ncbi:MAG TPA: translation initiation factor IF-2 [Patescibacteria group bacterium]|nr:translation initiation factor IF-2 [Patescibacteria group bacterium]